MGRWVLTYHFEVTKTAKSTSVSHPHKSSVLSVSYGNNATASASAEEGAEVIIITPSSPSLSFSTRGLLYVMGTVFYYLAWNGVLVSE